MLVYCAYCRKQTTILNVLNKVLMEYPVRKQEFHNIE